jgi:hypothetical protein
VTIFDPEPGAGEQTIAAEEFAEIKEFVMTPRLARALLEDQMASVREARSKAPQVTTTSRTYRFSTNGGIKFKRVN